MFQFFALGYIKCCLENILGHYSPRRSQTLSISPADLIDGSVLSSSVPASAIPGLQSPPPVRAKKESVSGENEETKSDSETFCDARGEHAGIQTMFEQQAVRLLKYLLQKDGLDETDWLPVLWPLTQNIAYSVQPDILNRKDDMDILTYIHVKTLLSRWVYA